MRPVVFDTETPSKLRLIDNLCYDGLIDLDTAKQEMMDAMFWHSRIGQILAPRGIDFIQSELTPDTLGLRNLHFITNRDREGQSYPHIAAEAIEGIHALPELVVNRELLSSAGALVLKSVREDRGINKFLLETDVQKQTAAAYFDNHPFDGRIWRLQPFIEPVVSEVATNIRVVATAAGELLGAAVVYNMLAETSPITSSSGDSSDTDAWALLADPTSEYYLGSREFRSYSESNCGEILLKVNGILPSDYSPTPLEQDILAGLSITDQSLPEHLQETTVEAARTIGPSLALLMGFDFQPSRANYYCLEINSWPAPGVTRRWLGLSSAMKHSDVVDRMLEIAADGIVREASTT
ncbi:MAG: hypothetical protein AAF413_00525 [Patescibacteria group bacterium]